MRRKVARRWSDQSETESSAVLPTAQSRPKSCNELVLASTGSADVAICDGSVQRTNTSSRSEDVSAEPCTIRNGASRARCPRSRMSQNATAVLFFPAAPTVASSFEQATRGIHTRAHHRLGTLRDFHFASFASSLTSLGSKHLMASVAPLTLAGSIGYLSCGFLRLI